MERVYEVILASTETSVKLTVPFKEETCYTRLQIGDFSAGSTLFLRQSQDGETLMQPLRSLLFVPGNKPTWMEKALQYGADALILDLEDSVPGSDKRSARAHVTCCVSSSDKALASLPSVSPSASFLRCF